MTTKKTILAAALALLAVAGPALAATVIVAADEGLATIGGGGTTIDLAAYPIQQIFGAPVTSNPVVSLIGESLGPGTDLAGVNTIVRRPTNITIGSTGTGTGPISLVALRLVSESPVTIGSSAYDLRVFISEFSGSVAQGSVTFTFSNGDGGTFTSQFNVRPRLVFTDRTRGTSTVIDCGAVTCANGQDIRVQATNVPFTISGGPGNFQPSVQKVKPLKAGLKVDGDGNGVAELTTFGTSNFFPGVSPTTGFPISGFTKYEFPIFTRQTVHFPFILIPSAVSAVRPFPTQFANGFP
jgi:hypothetical protein